MRYRWEDLSDSELRVRIIQRMQHLNDPYTVTSIWHLVRRRDEPEVAAVIDKVLGN